MDKTWIVVADEGVACFMARAKAGADLKEVERITDAAAHATDAALRRDAAGRRSGGGASGSSVTTSAGQDESHKEAELFARRVADKLAESLHAGKYEKLHIGAAPRFLGLLRKALSAQVKATVLSEIDKDLTHEDARSLTQRFFPAESTS